MADLFLSHARADRASAAALARALEEEGRGVSWDRQPVDAIEHEIAAAGAVLVAWSSEARESLWVRAVANAAHDQGKLVQISLDGATPPPPFHMLRRHAFEGWVVSREHASWAALQGQLDGQFMARGPEMAVLPMVGPEPALQGFGKLAALGWAALATATILAFCTLMVARRLISAYAFGVVSVGAAIVAAGLLLACAFILLRTEQASRR